MSEVHASRVYTVDVEEDAPSAVQAVEPEAAKPKRPRGRPPGALGKTTRTDERLQSSDFYFLRAVTEKIDHKEAAERYLAHRGPMDRRTAIAYEKHLRREMQRNINAVQDVAAHKEASRQLGYLDAPAAVVRIGPSLEEFAQRFDADMYSEAELIELYVDEYGVTPGGAGDTGGVSPKAKLQALNWLQSKFAVEPVGGEPCELWIEKGIATEVRTFGVLTLADLVNWINLTGRRWADKLPKVGRVRARRLMVFLLQNEESIGVRISPRVRIALEDRYQLPGTAMPADALAPLPSTSLVRAPVLGVAQSVGIVPLENLSWPAALLGVDGTFRSASPNTYGASSDAEALQQWFEALKEKSPQTQESYRRAVERLVLWAIVEKRRALSSLTTQDIGEFKDFLRDPPAHWVNRLPVMRFSAEWRPLRGPMGDTSLKQTMSAVATLYNDWLNCGYLSANAVASVRSTKRTELRMDVTRSFTEEDLAAIRATWIELPDGPSKRRMRAVMLLLQTSGLRRAECVSLTWGQLAPIVVENRLSGMMGVKFIGKGDKEREVPIKEETLQALEAHYQDRLALIAAGVLPYGHMSKEDTPLLSVLDDRLTFSEGGPGMTPADARREGNATGALSAGRLYGILKGFFRKVASRPDLGDRQKHFLKASTHWLRHTFAHQALAATDKDLPVVQQLLGHADIGTTGIYVKADMTARLAAVSGIKSAL
jgi:site-specific recombinase XerD